MKKYTLEKRRTVFWNQVDKSPHPKGCWVWTGSTIGRGYGRVFWDYKNQYVHRISYAWHYGQFPDELFVLHSCDNRLCVNPAHLSLGTHQDNMDDMRQKGRAYTPKNELNHWHKLSDQQVADIRARYRAGGVRQQTLADEYKVHYSTISYIVNDKRRTA